MDTNSIFLKDYKLAIETVGYYRADICKDTGLVSQEIKVVIDKGGMIAKAEAEALVKDKIQGMDILKMVDRRRYGSLLTGIRDKYALGIDLYPTSINKSYEVIESYTVTHRLQPKRKTNKEM